MKTIHIVRTRQVGRAIRAIIGSTGMVLILVTAAWADEKVAANASSTTKKIGKQEKAKVTETAKRGEESNRVITGSYIPHKVKRNGPMADTTSPVYIIDRKAIDQTGATTVSQVLRRRVSSVR